MTVKKCRAISAVFAGFGTLSIIGAFAVYFLKDKFTQIPRADIAHIGFLAVGAILLVISAAIYTMSKDKKAMIEENDERSGMISGKAGAIAFAFQTVILTSALFLLCFMGYMNSVSALTLLSVGALSCFVYLAASAYLRHKM